MAGFKATLQETKKAKPVASKKSSVCAIDKVPKNVKTAVNAYIAAVKAKKEAEAVLKLQGSIISSFCSEKYDEKGFENDFHKSFSVASGGNELKYVTQNRFSVSNEDEDALRDLFQDNFDKLFVEDFSVQFKSEVFENERLQDELMNLCGPEDSTERMDNFNKFFSTFSSFSVAKDFDEKIFDVVKSQDELDEVRVYVKPYKASLK